MASYDCIVIGAGYGGLTAAALLAADGVRVLLLEAQDYPGGCAGNFEHRGYKFDVGATLFSGYGAGGPHSYVAERLGIGFPVKLCEPAMRVYLPDRTVTRYSEPTAWNRERRRAFPGQQTQKRRFWRAQERIAAILWRFWEEQPVLPPRSSADIVTLLKSFRPELLLALPYLRRTVGGLLRGSGVTDPAMRMYLDAQLRITSQLTSEDADLLFGAAALDMPRQGVFHVEGGSGAVARIMAEAFVERGGDLRYNTKAKRILVSSNRVAGVELEDGEVIRAPQVIGNLTLWNLAEMLGDKAPAPIRRAERRVSDEWGAFTCYLGIGPGVVPDDAPLHHQVVLDKDKPLAEGNLIFLSLSDPGDTSRAPTGHRAATISTHTDVAPWWADKKADRRLYLARKKDYTDRALAGVDRVFPGLLAAHQNKDRATLPVVLPGSPATFARYTGRYNGYVGGIPQRPDRSGLWSISFRTGLEGCWMIGDSVFPGQSTAAVALSGIYAYRAVTRELGRKCVSA